MALNKIKTVSKGSLNRNWFPTVMLFLPVVLVILSMRLCFMMRDNANYKIKPFVLFCNLLSVFINSKIKIKVLLTKNTLTSHSKNLSHSEAQGLKIFWSTLASNLILGIHTGLKLKKGITLLFNMCTYIAAESKKPFLMILRVDFNKQSH